MAAAFDRGMAPEDWFLVTSPSTTPAVVSALMGVWQGDVLPQFAERYKFTL